MIVSIKPDPNTSNGSENSCLRKYIDEAEKTVGYLALAWLVVLHFKVLNHAGALWRDEIDSVNISQLPSFSSIFNMSEYDSYPILWFVILRCWYFFGLGYVDSSLRALGFIIGLGMIGVLWWSARYFQSSVPLISVSIFCASATTLRYGDSMRAYGCGVMLMLLMLSAIWRLTQQRTMIRTIAALVISVLSVQCLYQNAILLFAGSIAGVSVCLRKKTWRTAIIIIGIGVIAAASLVPYFIIITRVQRWNILAKMPITFPWLILKFFEAISASGISMIWIWTGLYIITMLVCFDRFLKPNPDLPDRQKDLALFVGVALSLGILGYFLFLRVLGYITQPWYYLLLMAFLAILFESMVQVLVQPRLEWRVLRLIMVVLILLLTSANAWRATKTRLTNVDLLSAKLESLATRNDLIILHPWWPGLTFARYFRGSTPWVTLPEITDHSFMRYDLIKQKMVQDEPIKPIMEQISRTLQSGQRVWIVCDISFLSLGEKPEYLRPAPNGSPGWHEWPYALYWIRQVAHFMKTRARTIVEIPVPTDGPINSYEDFRIYRVDGWKASISN